MQEHKSGIQEAADAAGAVHGAVKTGKAISAAAEGAAAGGPYGAVAGALWGAKNHVGKILAAVAVLILLPILFVLMLPSLIFGGLTSSGSQPNQPAAITRTQMTSFLLSARYSVKGSRMRRPGSPRTLPARTATSMRSSIPTLPIWSVTPMLSLLNTAPKKNRTGRPSRWPILSRLCAREKVICTLIPALMRYERWRPMTRTQRM